MIITWIIFFAVCHSASSRELDVNPISTIIEDTKISGWQGWTKNTQKYVGWRQQSRAGTGQIVYSVCESRLPKMDADSAVGNEDTGFDFIQLGNVKSGVNETGIVQTIYSSDKQPEFWLFSPPHEPGQALSVVVDLSYQIQSCNSEGMKLKDGSNCRETVDLMVRQSSQKNRSTNTEEYKLVDVISSEGPEFPDFHRGSSLFRRYVSRFRPNTQWFQIAFRDFGACLLIDRLTIYHLSCPPTEVNLIRLPQTQVGHNSEIRSVRGTCIEGAVPGRLLITTPTDRFRTAMDYKISNQVSNLNAFCMLSGNWHIDEDVRCECDAGYEINSNEMKCVTCMRGTYKPNAGNKECEVCPLNSVAPSVGQLKCECLPGYFRLPPDNTAESICVGPPSAPRNLNAVQINGTSVQLAWDWPIRTGGLNRTLFQITCQGCSQDSVTYEPGNLVNCTRVLVKGLNPLSRYQFDVYAQNEVSRLANALWNNAASVIVTTRAAPTTLIGDISYKWLSTTSVQINWKVFQVIERGAGTRDYTVRELEQIRHERGSPNFQICLIKAQLAEKLILTETVHEKLQFSGSSNLSRLDPGLVKQPDAVYFTSEAQILLQNLSQTEEYLVQIRAYGTQAYGPYSSPIHLLNWNAVKSSQANALGSNTAGHRGATLDLASQFKIITSTSPRDEEGYGGNSSLSTWRPSNEGKMAQSRSQVVVTALMLSVGLAAFISIVLLMTLIVICCQRNSATCRDIVANLRKLHSDSHTEVQKLDQMVHTQLGSTNWTALHRGWHKLTEMIPPACLIIDHQVGDNCLGEVYVGSLVFPRPVNKTAHAGLRSRIRALIPRGLKRIWSFTNETEENLGLCRNVHRIALRNADLVHSPTHMHGVKTQLDGSTLVLMQVVRQAKLYSGFIASRLHSQRSVPAGTQRLFSAVSLTVQLKHCNVARVFGCSRLGLQPVIVTEFLVRGQLDQFLDKLLQQPMNLSEITVGENGEIFAEFPIDLLVQMLLDITSGLEYLFYEGFVYGHLTSAMILLSSELRCKLRILFHPVAPTHTSELLRYEQAMQEDRISDETNNGRSVVAGTNPFWTKIVNSWKEVNGVDAEQQNSACSPMSTGLTLNNQRTVCFEERKLTPSHQYASRTSAEPQTRMAHGMMTCPCEHIHLKDSPIGIFHSVIHALDTRQPNYPAEELGITFRDPDRSRVLNIEDELKFQDLWCLGGIMAELVIAHILLSDNQRTRVYQLCEVEPHPQSDEVFQNTACIGHLLPASAKTLSPRYSNSRLRSIVPDYLETKECLLNPLTASSQYQFHTLQTEHTKKSAAVTCAPVEISLSGITTWDVFGKFVHQKFPDFDFHLILQRLRGSAPQHRPSISRIRRYFYEVYAMLSHKQMIMEATPNLHMKSCGTMRKSYVQWSDVSASLEV